MAFRSEWLLVAVLALGLVGGFVVPAASQDRTDYPESQEALRDPARRLRIARRIDHYFAEAETDRAAGNCQQRRVTSLHQIQTRLDRIEQLQAGTFPNVAPSPMAEGEGFSSEAREEYRRRLVEARLQPCTPPPPDQEQIRRIEQYLADARNARASGACFSATIARRAARNLILSFEPTGTPRSPLLENWRSVLRAEEALGCVTAGAAPRSANLCPSTIPAGTNELNCLCPPGPYSGAVYGSFHYSTDSGLCAAALHAGVIGPRGGSISASIRSGKGYYVGRTRNGVTSLRAGASDRSFRLAGSNDPLEERLGDIPLCRHQLAVYPAAERASAITCRCIAGYPGYEGSVYGSGPYTSDSSICTAARHAGALTSDDDFVLVFASPGLNEYPGSTRNGVTSRNWGYFGESMNVQPGLY